MIKIIMKENQHRLDSASNEHFEVRLQHPLGLSYPQQHPLGLSYIAN